jgi:hypothetical protein
VKILSFFFDLIIVHLFLLPYHRHHWRAMSRLSSSVRSCRTSIASGSRPRVTLVAGTSARYISNSAPRLRDTPVRRTRDPLDTSPDAVRHRLPTGETFIVRPPPTAPTPYNFGPSQTTVSYPSTSTTLPPALRPRTRLRISPEEINHNLSSEQIASIQALRKQDPIKYTISHLARMFKCTPTIIKISAPLSSTVRKFKEEELETRRANWGFNKTLQRELRKERKALW